MSFVIAILLAAAAQPGPCPAFRELRPPRIVRDRSVFFLYRSVDPDWFTCARRSGGKVNVRTEVERAGVWTPDQTESASPEVHIGAWASNYCGRIGKTDPSRLRFVIEADGPLAPMAYVSETRPALCACTVAPTTDLRATPAAGGLTLKASVTPAHVACLHEQGSSLEVRAYTGKTEAEAKAKTKPAWVLRDFDKKPDATVLVPRKALCAGGAREAVFELSGRGNLASLTGYGSEHVHLDCKESPQ
jgi:hypothetical protein